jgi:hypothetical protein
MARFLVILPFVVVALDVFAIIDVILTEHRKVRALNKFVWIVIVVLLPIIGALLWFFLGKERQDPAAEPRRLAPDDDPNFLRNMRRDEEQDERIRRLEQELAELDDDPPKE